MISKKNHHPPVRSPAPETSVQPDDVIGEHRVAEDTHRHSVIHRRDAPRLIRGQRNPKSRNGRPRSVRGQDPEHREPRRKRRKNFSLLKPVWIVFCVQIAQAPSRSIFCFLSQTSEWATRKKLLLLHNKPLFARSSRFLRRMDSSKGRYELFGCTGCVNRCTRRGALTILIFRR